MDKFTKLNIPVTIRLEDRDVETTLNPSLIRTFPSWFKAHRPDRIFFCSTRKSDPRASYDCTTWTDGVSFVTPLPLVLRNLILLDEGLPTINLNDYQGYFDTDLEAYNDICESCGEPTLTWSDIKVTGDGEVLIWKEGEGWTPSNIFFGRETF